MFLKRCVRKKDGKVHAYWALVKSVRTARGPRHRTVAFLGELSAGARTGWAHLAKRLEGEPDPLAQGMLFPAEEEVPERIEVKVREVRVERRRDFGQAWLALVLWRTLGLDRLLDENLPRGRETVPWSVAALAMAAGRLCSPGSERHTAEAWFPRTALPDLLGVKATEINPDRLYRTLDRLLPLQDAIERHLRERLGRLFDVRFDLLLYDITSTFFEGAARRNPQAARGYSRDGRPGCKQVCVALVVTREGVPLAHRVFDGNRTDATTVEEIVGEVEREFGRADRLWVMDRGMVSEENLAFLRRRGGRYVVGTPRPMLRRFEKDLLDAGWNRVEAGVEVKVVAGPDETERFVLCRSRERREKERAIHERFAARIEAGLERLGRRLSGASRRVCSGDVERQIGRLLERNQRAAALFSIRLSQDARRRSGLSLSWRKREDLAAWHALSEGAYLLRTNIAGMGPKELWRTYIQLTEAEGAFRTIKSDLVMRPLWHQTAPRVRAHILVAFLGYVLWKTLSKWMERSGLGTSPRVLLDEIRGLGLVDVILPTTRGREVRLRCVAAPDPPLAALLSRLGLRPPGRLGPPRWIEAEAEM